MNNQKNYKFSLSQMLCDQDAWRKSSMLVWDNEARKWRYTKANRLNNLFKNR